MRRLMLLAVIPLALGGLLGFVSCERDNYRDVLPLRPLPGPANAVAMDMARPPDLATPPDMSRPPDMATPPDLSPLPDMHVTDM
jgi:hypothetical protein